MNANVSCYLTCSSRYSSYIVLLLKTLICWILHVALFPLWEENGRCVSMTASCQLTVRLVSCIMWDLTWFKELSVDLTFIYFTHQTADWFEPGAQRYDNFSSKRLLLFKRKKLFFLFAAESCWSESLRQIDRSHRSLSLKQLVVISLQLRASCSSNTLKDNRKSTEDKSLPLCCIPAWKPETQKRECDVIYWTVTMELLLRNKPSPTKGWIHPFIHRRRRRRRRGIPKLS